MDWCGGNYQSACSSVLVEKVIVAQLVRPSCLYRPESFIIMLTKFYHWTLSQAKWIQPTFSHHIFFRSILMLSFCLYLVFFFLQVSSTTYTKLSSIHLYPEAGGSRSFWNSGSHLQDCTVWQPRLLQYELLATWKPQIPYNKVNIIYCRQFLLLIFPPMQLASGKT